MAGPVVTPLLSDINLAAATTSWAGFTHSGGATPTAGLEQDIFIQGSAAISAKISGTNFNKGIWVDFGSGIDMTISNRHLYIWVANTTIANGFTIANGGIYIIAGSSTSNWSKWYIGGSDYTTSSGLEMYVLDLNKRPSESSATLPTLTSMQWFGAGLKQTGTAKSENLVVDAIRYGTGLNAKSGQAPPDENSWEHTFSQDDLNANKWGVIQKRSGVYYLKGEIQIGDAAAATTTVWNDTSGSTVVFENPQYHNGESLVSSIDSPNLYKITLQGNATGTTNISFGQVLGTGDDRQGISGGSIQSDGPKWTMDGETDIADLDTVNLYGMQVQGAGVMKFSGSTKTDIISCSFTECDELQPNDAEVLKTSIVTPVPNRGLEVVSGQDYVGLSFVAGPQANEAIERAYSVDLPTALGVPVIDNTTAANNTTANDWPFFPVAEGTTDYTAIGSKRHFTSLSINVGTAGVAGVVVWEYSSSPTAWTALSNVVDGTNGFTTSGTNTVSFDVPTNWAALSVGGEIPLYYVRARITTVYTTNPLGTQGFIVGPIEHSTHVPVEGTFAYENWKFFGTNTAHVENSSVSTLVDSYAFSNQSATSVVGRAGVLEGAGQSITGTAGELTRLNVELQKVGTPTGNMFAKLYAHSGSFGTSSVPDTGTLLATSNALDVSTVPTAALTEVSFEFEDGFTLVAATNYVVTLEYSGGDGSNYTLVGIDNTAPGHAGNFATWNGTTWSAVSGSDMCFLLYRDGLVIINGTLGANPSTDDNTGSPAGATEIVVAVPIEINGVTEGAQCSMHAAAGGDLAAGTEIMNQAAASTGIAAATFNYTTDQPVVARARSSGIPAAAIADDGGVLVDETTVAKNRATTNDVTLFPATPVVNVDQYYFGGLTTFEEVIVRVGTAGVGTYVLTWEYWNGAWVTLTTTQADDLKATGQNYIRFTAPGDWATTTVNSQGPYYYVRARWTSGTMTTSPIGDNITVKVTKYLPFRQDRTITSAGLSVVATWVKDTIA